MYLLPNRMHITHEGVFISAANSYVQIPSFCSDEHGVFILCKKEEVCAEAQEHYDNAQSALIEAVGHSMMAGAAVEIPPVAVYEAYQAVEAWKECAREYNAGVEAEKKENQ